MQELVVTLLVCSVTMSVLALAYRAAAPLLAKRYSEQSLYYGWLVIVLGLIIPFRPRLCNPIVKVGVSGSLAAPVIQIGNGAHAHVPQALPAAVSGIPWWPIAAAVWLAGVLAVLGYYAVKHRRFLKLTARWSEPVTDGRILALLRDLKTQMGISGRIGLQFCDCVASPMLIGLAEPRILLPRTDFAQDELRFILKHELVHHRRRDLWCKCLLLLATAVHWFNPVVWLTARAVDLQCELSCDAQVVRRTGADTRRSYSETIIGVVRYKSNLKTALSTNFYGGRDGMKTRIFSIMDMGKKKAGAVVLCGALLLTLGTGAAFAADAAAQNPAQVSGRATPVTPWIAVACNPDPDTYAKYAPFGVTVSEDGAQLRYQGQPVRLFTDEGADTEAFYVNGAGSVNLSAVRNAAGTLTGVERITAQKARAYQDTFFAEERAAAPEVRDTVRVGPDKYEQYQPFGVTCSGGALYFNGQRVKCFVDQPAGGGAQALWTDNAGTVNAAAVRDASGGLTGVERISDEKAQEYQAASEDALAGLDESIEARINARHADG